MSAKIICLASPKGGSGKTMLTCSFGTFLSFLDKRVLLIDTDIATNGLSLLYLKEVTVQKEIARSENRDPKGIYDVSVSQCNPEIVSLKSGIDLIPASYEFLNDEMPEVENFKIILKTALSRLRESYDFIFLDAQAGADESAEAAISKDVSDEVVIVAEYDPMSAAGVERLKGIFRDDLTYNRTWILLNKVLPEFVKSFSDFLEVAKYLNPIPWDPDVVRAYARRRIALDVKHGNEHTLALMQTLKTLLHDDISIEMEEWVSNRSGSMLRPILEQHEDTKKELESLIEMEAHISAIERQRSKIRLLFSLVAGVGLTASSVFILKDFFSVIDKYFSWEMLTIFLFVAIAFAMNIVFTSSKRETKDVVGMAELRRERARLEEKLNKLESLKEADIETLIKSKK